MPGSYKKKGERHRREAGLNDVETFEKIGQEMKLIQNTIDKIKQPDGKNKDNPARYCKDMYRCNEGSKNGKLYNPLYNPTSVFTKIILAQL